MSDEPKNRIPPLPREEWTDAAREVFAFWGEPNSWEEGSKTSIIMIMANNTDLAKAYNIWGKHMLVTNTVPIRPREIIVLRIAWKLKNQYEWHNHVGYGLKAGLPLEEIAAIGKGPDAGNWNEEDRAILRAIDEQMELNRIGDATWATLSKYFNRQQLMDIVFTIGQYVMTSWAIESFGIPLEGHVDKIGFDLKTQSGQTPGATLKPTEKWGG